MHLEMWELCGSVIFSFILHMLGLFGFLLFSFLCLQCLLYLAAMDIFLFANLSYLIFRLAENVAQEEKFNEK